MAILLMIFIIGWILTGFVISLIKLIILAFKPNAGLYAELGSIFLAGILILSIFCTNIIDISSTVESSIQSYIFKLDPRESGDSEPSTLRGQEPPRGSSY